MNKTVKKVVKKLKVKIPRSKVKTSPAVNKAVLAKVEDVMAKADKKIMEVMAKPMDKKEQVKLNAPMTKEQEAGVPSVVKGASFEGVKRIDHLPLKEQIDAVFNPLQFITKTTVTDAVSESTFIVKPTDGLTDKPKN
jgi:hypothetical protein